VLYRLFPWDPAANATSAGGALFNPRAQQGSGRHDNPGLYGAVYTARVQISAIAEWLAGFRGQRLAPADFARMDGRRWALVGLDDAAVTGIVDLDDPRELVARHLRPSGVATRTRSVTQEIAGTLFAEGFAGVGWWSTLEASWPNVTLFAERALHGLTIREGPREIGIHDPVVRAAAAAVGVILA